jgi:hypothetical protein
MSHGECACDCLLACVPEQQARTCGTFVRAHASRLFAHESALSALTTDRRCASVKHGISGAQRQALALLRVARVPACVHPLCSTLACRHPLPFQCAHTRIRATRTQSTAPSLHAAGVPAGCAGAHTPSVWTAHALRLAFLNTLNRGSPLLA